MAKVAIDGPAGAGKSSIAKAVARSLGWIYIDTGAMYRAAGLNAVRNNISIKEDPEAAAAATETLDINIKFENGEQLIFIGNENVSEKIRTPEASASSSDISAIPRVREILVSLQRKLAEGKDVIMDGRDIGTHVFPDAEVKIFLTAAPETRAKRRFLELSEKGVETTFEEVLAGVIERDRNDSTRKASPLKKAEDAIVLDTSDLTFDLSVKAVLDIIKKEQDL